MISSVFRDHLLLIRQLSKVACEKLLCKFTFIVVRFFVDQHFFRFYGLRGFTGDLDKETIKNSWWTRLGVGCVIFDSFYIEIIRKIHEVKYQNALKI